MNAKLARALTELAKIKREELDQVTLTLIRAAENGNSQVTFYTINVKSDTVWEYGLMVEESELLPIKSRFLAAGFEISSQNNSSITFTW
jgi:hypothetical protein